MARVTLIVGQAQQGKTTLALAILKKEAVRGLILDPVRSKPFTGLAPTFDSWKALASFLASDKANGRWLVSLRSMEFEDYTWVLRAAPFFRHVTLLVDEGLTFSQDAEALPPLIKCCRMNAHFGGGIGVPLLITAQRPMDLPADIRSQADRWYSFRQEEPRDLEFLSQRCAPAYADQVAVLAPHQYLTYPPTEAARSKDDASGQDGAGVRAGGSRGIGRASYGPTAQRDSEAAGPDGRQRVDDLSPGRATAASVPDVD